MSLSAAPAPTSVYLYYDTRGILIYVGITSRGIARNSEHNHLKSWWPLVARQEVEHYPTRSAAHAREVALIRDHLPPFNVQHNPHHAELRTAYEQLANATTDAVALAKQLNRRLPLTVVAGSMTKTSITLRTKPEHVAIASSLIAPDPLPSPPPSRGGLVKGITIRGGVAFITITRGKWAEIHDAWGIVRRVDQKRPIFQLTTIELTSVKTALRRSNVAAGGVA